MVFSALRYLNWTTRFPSSCGYALHLP